MFSQNHDVRSISLVEMLNARERRAGRQQAWIKQWQAPLISLTLVSPGPVKLNADYVLCMSEAIKSAHQVFHENNLEILACEEFWLTTGPEAFWSINDDATKLKACLIRLEEEHPLGRLWDFDVFLPNGEQITRSLLGLKDRTCLICNKPAHACSSMRRHTLAEVIKHIEAIIRGYVHA